MKYQRSQPVHFNRFTASRMVPIHNSRFMQARLEPLAGWRDRMSGHYCMRHNKHITSQAVAPAAPECWPYSGSPSEASGSPQRP